MGRRPYRPRHTASTSGPTTAFYLTDDLDHTVRKFTTDGKLLQTLGTSGQPSDTGIVGIDYRTIRRPGPPFHRPTNVALAADGSVLVTDGYGNCRVHHFAPDGRLLSSWGEPGDGPGQFHLPHGIAVDRDGRIYVADRENSRIQIFSPQGKFLSQWTDVARPMQVFIDKHDNVFVAEVGWARSFSLAGTGDRSAAGTREHLRPRRPAPGRPGAATRSRRRPAISSRRTTSGWTRMVRFTSAK